MGKKRVFIIVALVCFIGLLFYDIIIISQVYNYTKFVPQPSFFSTIDLGLFLVRMAMLLSTVLIIFPILSFFSIKGLNGDAVYDRKRNIVYIILSIVSVLIAIFFIYLISSLSVST